MKTRQIENEFLRITVSDTGAELISVVDKETGKERLWTADPAVWNRHAPILFPFVGKLTDGKYRVAGKEYVMKTQHGFARDQEFDCREESADHITHCLTASDLTKEIYPWDFGLTVKHSISAEQPRELEITWTIENRGSDRMYYSIGGHPGFLMPEGVRKEDCFISFPGMERLTYFSANSAGFALPGELHELQLDNGCAPYQEDVPDTWIFEDQKIETVGIVTPDGKPLATMNCKGFPMLAVWANPKGTFICLEPWFGRTDDAGFAGTLEEKKGMQVLEGGEKREISYSIRFHPAVE